MGAVTLTLPITDPLLPESSAIEPRAIRIVRGFEAYREDRVRLVSRELRGMTHLVSTRRGLFAVHAEGYRLIAHGFFFGIARRGDTLYVFEACDQPHGPTRQGRIVAIQMQDGRIDTTHVVAKGLDNGCHGIGFIASRLHVTDTYNQRILQFSEDFQERVTLSPLPVPEQGRWAAGDPQYRHVNSLLKVGDRILLLLHNVFQHSGRKSEIAVFDKSWQPIERRLLDGRDCHSLACLQDGSIVTCGSRDGELLFEDGRRVPLTSRMTRGLAIGTETIVVGTSTPAERVDRTESLGSVLFLDTGYRLLHELPLPGAPTDLCSLGNDQVICSA